MKNDVIQHLKNISNQDTIIHFLSKNPITIKELIIEVDNETEIGKDYIKRWIRATNILKKD